MTRKKTTKKTTTNVDFDADVVYVKIGCMRKTLSDWLKDFSTIGAKDDYTPDQINEYGEYLKLCKSLYGLKLKEKNNHVRDH